MQVLMPSLLQMDSIELYLGCVLDRIAPLIIISGASINVQSHTSYTEYERKKVLQAKDIK
jgi:hypothetical protein